MRIRLYFDEDSTDKDLVDALRSRGVDVITAYEEGLLGADDEQELKHAGQLERVLYSFNVRDFWRIHTHFLKKGVSHSGIILARQQLYSVGEQMRRLVRLISERSAEEMRDQVEFLSAWG